MALDGGSFQVLSLHESELRVWDYQKRKVHKKTRSGCLACKDKRVKCDEVRPICMRCWRNGRNCAYSQSNGPGSGKPPSSADSFSSLSNATLIPFPLPEAKNGTPSIHILKHLDTYWEEILHIPRNEGIVSLITSNELVGSTLMALTACHLRHLSPGVVQHRVAEHFQESRALQQFNRLLNTPRYKLSQQDVNNLLLSAMFLNIVAFTLPESDASKMDDPATSWVFSTSQDRLGWLALQTGLKPLLLSMSAHLDKAITLLSPIFLGNTGNWATVKVANGLQVVPPRWVEFFAFENSGAGCDADPSSPSDVFRAPIVLLAQLRELEPAGANVFKYFQFLSKVDRKFRALLYERNEKALWIFGYWLGLLCRFEDMWWCTWRSKRDYTATCLWLHQCRVISRAGKEGELWKNMMAELESAPELYHGNCSGLASE